MKVVICGAGIIGCSIAYHLTLKGVSPSLVECCGVACSASGKAGGFLAKDWNDGSPVGPLARLSFDMHDELSETFQNCDYRKLDTLSVSLKEGATSSRKDSLPSWINGPVVHCSKIGSTSTTAQVHPRKLTEAMFKAATEKGATLIKGNVNGIQLNDAKTKVTGVKVDEETIPADVVVIAMGPWSVNAAQWLPLPSVDTMRAHSVTLQPQAPVTPHALFTEMSFKHERPRSPEFYPRPDGDVYVCGMADQEELPNNPSDIKTNTESCKKLKTMAGMVSDQLKEAEVGVQQACYLPFSPDQVPLIGRVTGVEGAFVATGHGVWGILNGPATGAALAELIVDGECKLVDLSPFDPSRFK